MISEARLLKILIAPVVTEKSTEAAQKSTFVFKVANDATKEEIKAAVQMLFNVSVLNVRTLNVMGKSRRTVHGMGKRSDWKKAYVTLPEGTNIDVAAAQQAEKESK